MAQKPPSLRQKRLFFGGISPKLAPPGGPPKPPFSGGGGGEAQKPVFWAPLPRVGAGRSQHKDSPKRANYRAKARKSPDTMNYVFANKLTHPVYDLVPSCGASARVSSCTIKLCNLSIKKFVIKKISIRKMCKVDARGRRKPAEGAQKLCPSYITVRGF